MFEVAAEAKYPTFLFLGISPYGGALCRVFLVFTRTCAHVFVQCNYCQE